MFVLVVNFHHIAYIKKGHQHQQKIFSLKKPEII
jgi:hypothetical protein